MRILAILLLTTATLAQSPDTIYLHGNILTGAHLKSSDPLPTPARQPRSAPG